MNSILKLGARVAKETMHEYCQRHIDADTLANAAMTDYEAVKGADFKWTVTDFLQFLGERGCQWKFKTEPK